MSQKNSQKKKNNSINIKKTVSSTVSVAKQSTESLQKSSPVKPLTSLPQKRPAEDLPSTSSEIPQQLIAYVHEVSPTKSNRANTMEYFDVCLQTEHNQSQRAVCFTKSKRQLFVDRQQTKMPVKLTNFTMSTNGADILINNMTQVTQAEDGEYAFQIVSPPNSQELPFLPLKNIETSKPFDIVNVKGKVIKKSKTKTVGRNKLNLVETILSDGTTSIKLDIWENHISLVEVGGTYSFIGLWVREWQNVLNLATTQASKIVVLPEEEGGIFSSVSIDENDAEIATGSATDVKVTCISSIENIERFTQCPNKNCRKKIKQDAGTSLVHCDLCGHTMKRNRCKKNIYISAMAEISGNQQPTRVIFFKDVLLKIFPKLDDELTDINEINDEICQVLLSLENFSIQLKNNVVTAFQLNDKTPTDPLAIETDMT